MARQDEAVDARLRIAGDGAKRRRRGLVGAEDGEVLYAAVVRVEDGRRDRGGGGLEAHAHKDDLQVRICLGELHGV